MGAHNLSPKPSSELVEQLRTSKPRSSKSREAAVDNKDAASIAIGISD